MRIIKYYFCIRYLYLLGIMQKYVKHKTLNEMLQELPDVSQFILAMDTWLEKLMVIEAIIEADNEMQRIKDKIGMLHEI